MFDSEQRREAVDRLLAEHRELTARLSDPAVHQDPALARRLNRRFAELGAVVTAHRAWPRPATTTRRPSRPRCPGWRRPRPRPPNGCAGC